MRIVVLTGAGLSAESGLKTFRDAGGLWEGQDVMQVATPEGFAADPERVHRFYNARRARAAAAAPNDAHRALARLQAEGRHEVTLVTQNVDGLLEAAGAEAIHMHGELAGALCAACGARWPAPEEMGPADACPSCGARAVRPDVVWFGEVPYRMEEIAAALERADLFAAIGTSGEVWPAAGFVEAAADAGAETVEINLEPTGRRGLFDRVITGRASEAVPAWVAELLG
ncbi:NAD-dependent deacylase [Pseudoroseicyclus tamaricis]|uniref:NAD-dependent protein deacylase n=1 Tax=Pseudoroseicyclus tamaricis TaxID=2705421 RepID=A0A6B2JF12_9RHOB|nr:NAD-dependent deacylase [Pseudoroseicyclus tamaricis]NDU99542.1 NAD-dependent deacylase [Pseudoroseicyclus tamaricis]